MVAANYSEFRKDLKRFLDEAEENGETIVIKRKSGNGAVLISLEEYNGLLETVHLLKSEANAMQLSRSIKEYKQGNNVQVDLNNMAAE